MIAISGLMLFFIPLIQRCSGQPKVHDSAKDVAHLENGEWFFKHTFHGEGDDIYQGIYISNIVQNINGSRLSFILSCMTIAIAIAIAASN